MKATDAGEARRGRGRVVVSEDESGRESKLRLDEEEEDSLAMAPVTQTTGGEKECGGRMSHRKRATGEHTQLFVKTSQQKITVYKTRINADILTEIKTPGKYCILIVISIRHCGLRRRCGSRGPFAQRQPIAIFGGFEESRDFNWRPSSRKLVGHSDKAAHTACAYIRKKKPHMKMHENLQLCPPRASNGKETGNQSSCSFSFTLSPPPPTPERRLTAANGARILYQKKAGMTPNRFNEETFAMTKKGRGRKPCSLMERCAVHVLQGEFEAPRSLAPPRRPAPPRCRWCFTPPPEFLIKVGSLKAGGEASDGANVPCGSVCACVTACWDLQLPPVVGSVIEKTYTGYSVNMYCMKLRHFRGNLGPVGTDNGVRELLKCDKTMTAKTF
ncbi:hypothetical protein F2P81_005283 [Scophthalmus maximus]|uniref:Uncharacterized protein n=1 Tax=Scophthalmus maximus TaxID=52904 RepID=A0A6A4TFW2_SCOMX|nr:hypothetical protein F2P81_005283 [Scophthalmus maximus]